jgi:hypothetical protein
MWRMKRQRGRLFSMSTAIRGNTPIEEDQAVMVTRLLCEALGLTVPKTQLKYLTIALAETATEEIYHDPGFADRLKARFEGLRSKPPQKKGSHKNKAEHANQPEQPKRKLVLLNQIDPDRLNPYGIPDPVALLEAFGREQLPLALKEYSLSMLNRIAAEVQLHHPTTHPRNKRQKDAVIDYIVRYVVE